MAKMGLLIDMTESGSLRNGAYAFLDTKHNRTLLMKTITLWAYHSTFQWMVCLIRVFVYFIILVGMFHFKICYTDQDAWVSGVLVIWVVTLTGNLSRFPSVTDNKCKDHCKCDLCRCCSVCEETCKCTGAIRPLERYIIKRCGLWAFVHDSEESPEEICSNLLPDGFVRLPEMETDRYTNQYLRQVGGMSNLAARARARSWKPVIHAEMSAFWVSPCMWTW